MARKLSTEEINSRLEKYSHWELKDDQLYRKLVFKDFISAFTFMTRIAIHAEKKNHHPYWINVYNTLEIYLSTHDAGGISEKDFELANIIDNQ